MRERSEYELVCVQCGAKIVTSEAETTCRKCGSHVVIDWQGTGDKK